MANPQNPHGKGQGPFRKGPQRLQEIIDGCLEPTLRAKGFASSAIHLHWAEIVGNSLAPWSEPIQLKWPATPPGADPAQTKSGAVLTVKVEGAFALELQHQAPQVIERVNSFFGWRCVERINLKQGPVRKIAQPSARHRKPLSVVASQKIDTVLEGIEDQKLKASLARLGIGIMTKA